MKDYSRIGERIRNREGKITVEGKNAKTGGCPKSEFP